MNEPAAPRQPGIAADRTVMIVLAYLWVLALVPLLADGGDAEVRWHAKHGIVLTVVEVAALMAWSILMSILWIMTGGLFGCVFTIEFVLSPLIGLLVIIVHIVAIVRGLNGQRLIIPYISEYADRF